MKPYLINKEDLGLLGARSLEGLNLSANSKRKKFVAAGPTRLE